MSFSIILSISISLSPRLSLIIITTSIILSSRLGSRLNRSSDSHRIISLCIIRRLSLLIRIRIRQSRILVGNLSFRVRSCIRMRIVFV